MDQSLAATRTLADLPSPPGVPLLGNALQLDIPRLHQVLEGWCGRYGQLFTIALPGKKALVCSDPALLHEVLRERPQRYRRYRPIEQVIAELDSNGVFSVEGEAWRPQRKLVMQALASHNFRAFFPVMQGITRRLHARWARAAAAGEPLEMGQELMRYTVDVTTALAFGEDPNTIDAPGDVIQEHLALLFPALMDRINAPFPLWRYLKLPKDYALERALRHVHAHVDALITRARDRLRERAAPTPTNVLEAMLLASDEPGSGIDDDAVRANVLTLLLAGEDTTAHTLAWTTWFLAQDAALQERLHAAAAGVLGAHPVCAAYEDVRRLDLLEGAAHEATRLKPVVPLLFLEPNEDVVLGGVAVPAGTPLFFVLRPAMLDGQRFGQPDRYLPERWLAGHAAVQPHDAQAYVQFGAGPRVCPGRHLAGVEMRLVLSMLLRGFRIELLARPEEIQERLQFTMLPSRMPVRLRAR
ncbi:MAG TPA: cytochrome P450 [Ramlibacter sp.]|nr:cytochrome P450 [Ramlibacter sp.]